MRFHASKFRLDAGVSLNGRAMRVAGLIQYEETGDAAVTRYLLTEVAGAPLVLEENPAGFAVLGTFPGTAQPQASGNSVSVLGEKYVLKGVRKLKLVGTDGQPPGGPPKGDLLLSGEFEGSMGTILRELVPTAGTQSFYLLKRLAKDDVLSNNDIAGRLEAGRRDAEIKAGVADEDSAPQSALPAILMAVVAIVVAAALAYSCASG